MTTTAERRARRKARRDAQKVTAPEPTSFKLVTFPTLTTPEKNDIILSLRMQNLDPALRACRVWFENGPGSSWVLMMEGTGRQAATMLAFVAGLTFARHHSMTDVLATAFASKNTSEY